MKSKLNIDIVVLFLVCFVSLKSTSQITRTEFEYHQGLIFFEIQVNQKDTLFALLDTGAEISAIDTNTSNKLKFQTKDTVEIAGSNTSIMTEVVEVRNLTLKNHHVKRMYPAKRDLSHSLTPNGRKLDMILGYDFFKNSIISIDFQKKILHMFYNSATLDTIPYIPFSLDHDIPRFFGVINDSIKFDFRLDTGASLFETDDVYLNITTSDWERIKKVNRSLVPEFFLYATGINNEQIELPVLKLKKIEIGKFVIENPYIIIQPELGYFASKDAVGFVSNNLLSKYNRVIIDYINNHLYVSK